MSETRRTARAGDPREGRLLLPLALLLLLVLSTFTVFAYRNAIDLLIEERRSEVRRQVLRLADEVRGTPPGQRPFLALPGPSYLLVAVAGPQGRPLAWTGELPLEGLFAPLEGSAPDEPAILGPTADYPSVIAFLPLGTPDGAVLRLDLKAVLLARQRQSLRILTWVVLGLNLVVLVWLTLYLRTLISPYEALLSRARELRPEGAEGSRLDDAQFLQRTVEQALSRLATPAHEEELVVLQRTLAPSVESGLMILDREGRVLVVNPRGVELLGIAHPTPRASLAEALASQPELLSLLKRSVEAGETLQREECTLEVEGRSRTFGLSVSPLRPGDGELRGFLVLFADLTEVQREAQESRLAESLAQLGELAAGVAHELRNSLGTLQGYVDLLRRRPDSVGGQRSGEYLEEIRRELRHLRRVVEDFLAFARPGTARLEPLDLVAMLRRLAGLHRPEVEVHLDLESPPAGAATALPGDAQLLEQAFRNLLDNATHASQEAEPPQSRVDVSIHWLPDWVEVRIADRGPGLPDAVRERLFQPFVTTRAAGVGLGLAMAHRIVTLHRGRLRLEDREGGGTAAVVAFPREALEEEGEEGDEAK